jgi:hypothetical protein
MYYGGHCTWWGACEECGQVEYQTGHNGLYFNMFHYIMIFITLYNGHVNLHNGDVHLHGSHVAQVRLGTPKKTLYWAL